MPEVDDCKIVADLTSPPAEERSPSRPPDHGLIDALTIRRGSRILDEAESWRVMMSARGYDGAARCIMP